MEVKVWKVTFNDVGKFSLCFGLVSQVSCVISPYLNGEQPSGMVKKIETDKSVYNLIIFASIKEN